MYQQAEPTQVRDDVEIRPEVAMYAAFARLNYRPWYALAEFVDNSLQSYLLNRQLLSLAKCDSSSRLVVDIDFLPNRITILDNAAGIARRDFTRAFLPGSPPPDTTGLSEFGLGMKAAACWFARRWTVRTSAIKEPIESTIVYNIPEITKQHLETLPVHTSPALLADHYTELSLEDLNVQVGPNTLAKVKRHLASIYRLFLNDGSLVLRVKGEALAYSRPMFLNAARFDDPGGPAIEWRRDFSLSLDDRRSVHGWAGLLSRGSVANAGFAVFRRRRLIEGSHGRAYRPESLFRKSNSYTYQRLVGELNVEGFTVSHTKDGVQWDECEDVLLARLRTELDSEPLPLLQQAESYRARTTRSRTTLASAAADVEHIVAQQVPPLIESQLRDVPDGSPLPVALSATRLEARCETEISLSHVGQRWRVSIELIADEAIYDWLEIAKEEVQASNHFLHIRVNVAHPFIARFTSPDGTELTVFARLAAGLAIAEVTARATGVKQAGTIRRNLNQLMHDALAAPAHLSAGNDGGLDD